jgi:hypothetical protein
MGEWRNHVESGFQSRHQQTNTRWTSKACFGLRSVLWYARYAQMQHLIFSQLIFFRSNWPRPWELCNNPFLTELNQSSYRSRYSRTRTRLLILLLVAHATYRFSLDWHISDFRSTGLRAWNRPSYTIREHVLCSTAAGGAAGVLNGLVGEAAINSTSMNPCWFPKSQEEDYYPVSYFSAL